MSNPELTAKYPGLEKLVTDMWETMYNSNGVGLAAPQVNKDIRLFVIDSTQVLLDFYEIPRPKSRSDRLLRAG